MFTDRHGIVILELKIESIRKLKLWLTGIEEGDVCTGSVKIKE